jgi:hypothetical protein
MELFLLTNYRAWRFLMMIGSSSGLLVKQQPSRQAITLLHSIWRAAVSSITKANDGP